MNHDSMPAGREMDVYDSMPAGREMDALVAEKVFGCRVSHNLRGIPRCWCGNGPERPHNDTQAERLPFYSQDISGAWKVMEKMWGARSVSIYYPGPYPGVKTIRAFWATDNPPRYASAEGDTVPLAICRAALTALKSGEKDAVLNSLPARVDEGSDQDIPV